MLDLPFAGLFLSSHPHEGAPAPRDAEARPAQRAARAAGCQLSPGLGRRQRAGAASGFLLCTEGLGFGEPRAAVAPGSQSDGQGVPAPHGLRECRGSVGGPGLRPAPSRPVTGQRLPSHLLPLTLGVPCQETLLVRCSRPGHPLVDKTYSFERVYGPAEPQEAVFAGVSPLLAALLDGHDVCVMAYGQTGSGKSHTMLGPPSAEDPGGMGIVPRAARELFRLLSGDPAGSLEADLSVLEVYNNGLFDLLAKDGGAATPGVRPAVTTRAGRTEVSPLTREAVRSAAELMSHVGGALQRRARLATGVHAHSSRSHLVVTVTLSTRAARGGAGGWQASHVSSRDPTGAACSRPSRAVGALGCSRRPQQQRHGRCFLLTGGPQPGCGLPGEQGDPPAQPVGGRRWSRVGRTSPGPPGCLPKSPPGPAEQEQVWAKMQLVDLAGSECAGVSAVAGAALREAACINRSLAALADVLGALAARRGHVPYRNSRLTHLLQDALGGDAELLLVLCVSPCAQHVAETLQSLGFGARARQAQRGAARSPARRWLRTRVCGGRLLRGRVLGGPPGATVLPARSPGDPREAPGGTASGALPVQLQLAATGAAVHAIRAMAVRAEAPSWAPPASAGPDRALAAAGP
ncbi:kinesin-like protein KIF25 [Talpa occidentalis]|uniref:kinesin-like protein KIF25 n=1 Tax=Talpa occidentalis TaxID=50954 RepID=UPI0023F8DE7B|nr:kinesin-like protein KIF25 [Talpa occidentalis]